MGERQTKINVKVLELQKTADGSFSRHQNSSYSYFDTKARSQSKFNLSSVDEKANLQKKRLELLNLDHKSQPNLKKKCSLDIMQSLKELLMHFKTDSADHIGSAEEINFKKMSHNRAQLLPLGGKLGERVSKSLTFYGGI